MIILIKYISEKLEKIPFESILFFTYHIWLFIMILSAILIIGTGIHSGLDVSLVLVTLGLFLLYIVPIVVIVQNIVWSKNDLKKVLCCMPLLIVGIIHTLTALAAQIRIVMYVRETDPFTYTLLIPVQRLVELVANPLIELIFNMNFPYNLLIPDAFYVVVLPASLLIYLLPSINYDKEKITKEMKQIALIPLICAIIPVILQTIRLKFGLIDDIMLKFFWTEILMNIGKLLFFLVPILGILYIKHYNRVIVAES